MKRIMYLSAMFVLAGALFLSCDLVDTDGDYEADYEESDIEYRAEMLGFSDVDTYETTVAEQCAAGNHANCDIMSDGSHQACPYKSHEGTCRDGSHHTGSDHCTHHLDDHHSGHHNGHGSCH